MYTYNPAKAKQLLAAAGYKPGSLTIELDAITSPSFDSATELLQQQLQAVGISLKINLQTVGQFYTGYYGKTTSLRSTDTWAGIPSSGRSTISSVPAAS